MTQDDVRRIEEAIRRPLPPAVRRFFLNYPTELRTTLWEVGVDDAGNPYTECAADNELSDNAELIIEMNARQFGYDADWPANMLVVGVGGCGETFWVDLDTERGEVYRFDAGTDPEYSDHLADSLEEWAQGLIEWYKNQ
jgi:hypothetical protein